MYGTISLVSAKQRSAGSLGDLMRTLFLLGLAVVIGISLLPRHHQNSVHPIDYLADLTVFAHRAPFPVLAPSPLPSGWQVTSFRTAATPSVGETGLHLGMVTSAVHYAALEETNGDAAAFLAAQVLNGREDGSITVGSADWQILRSPNGVVSLTRTASGVTVVLTGGSTGSGAASLVELQQLAATLAVIR